MDTKATEKKRIGQDWVSCKEHLPINGVDNRNKFLVRVKQIWNYGTKFEEEEILYDIAEWNDGTNVDYRNAVHDGLKVIVYNFDFDWDIDEGQYIEITHWREIPEIIDVEGCVWNPSRITENNYGELYNSHSDKWEK